MFSGSRAGTERLFWLIGLCGLYFAFFDMTLTERLFCSLGCAGLDLQIWVFAWPLINFPKSVFMSEKSLMEGRPLVWEDGTLAMIRLVGRTDLLWGLLVTLMGGRL